MPVVVVLHQALIRHLIASECVHDPQRNQKYLLQSILRVGQKYKVEVTIHIIVEEEFIL